MQRRRTPYIFGWLLLAAGAVFISGCAATGPMRAGGLSAALPSGQSLVVSDPFISAPFRTIDHEVGPMETLWRIAKEYDVSIQSIMETNGIRDPGKISVGQHLQIPQTRGIRPVIPLYRSHLWSYIVVHHTATDIGNASRINKAHQERGFWNGLGYHFLIDNGTLGKLDGQIEVSPRWIKQKDGAHCSAGGMNQKGIGVALVGNFSQGSVSKHQMNSLVFLVSTLMKHYQIPIEHVLGHRDAPGANTECPGQRFPWREFISKLRQSSS